MSTLAPAPSLPALPARRVHALDEPKDQRRVGLIGTVVAHGLLLAAILLLPEDLLDGDGGATALVANPNFEIELSPELIRPAAPVVPPQRFVEVNPAAPENVPDDTRLYGAQNQQVAQPVPSPETDSDAPKVDGEGKDDATALVSGLTAPEPQPTASDVFAPAFTQPEPPSLVPEKRVAEQAPAKAVNSLAGGEQLLGDANGGIGTTTTMLPPVAGAEAGAAAVKGTAAGRAATGGYFDGTPAIDRSRPQERPRLSAAAVNARKASTIKNEFGSENIGAVAYNAKWSAYGEYLQRLIDAVQGQWERLIQRSSFYPTSGSTVRVVFKIDASGVISEVVRVDGSGAELARRLCVSAITERAPYGDWTDDMIAVLGREQEITFTFFYQ
jgi:hypothetical protein